MISAAVEDYLKTIYQLSQTDQGVVPVTNSALAARLGLAAATVTNMVQKLAAPELDLLQYTPYQGVQLTAQGAQIALQVIRRHRLLELYLAERLGVPWDEVHGEAERLEHHISPALEERLAAALGDPRVDPHGHPIPDANGAVPPLAGTALAGLEPGQAAVILSVEDDDPALLRYLAGLGMYPGVALAILEREPFGGSLHVRVGAAPEGRDCALGLAAAARVRVTLSPPLQRAAAAAAPGTHAPP